MKKLFIYFSLVVFISALTASDMPVGEIQYKCMIQIKNYKGEGAYVIAVSYTHLTLPTKA